MSRRKRSGHVAEDPCPRCGKNLLPQWDTGADEPFWHCDHCDQSYCIDRVTPAIYMTCVDASEVPQ